MSRTKEHYLEIVVISVFLLLGLIFRLKGISTNHSFWADEALVSSFSREIILGKTQFIEGINAIGYQRLQTITVAIFFKLFGISEWSARLPSVIWGSLGIIFAYLIAKRHSNKWGGFLAAFLYTFLQLNLAHATEAKPYAAIETLLLMAIYFAETNLGITFVIALLATGYHYLGFIVFFPLIVQIFHRSKVSSARSIYFALGISALLIIVWLLRIDTMIGFLLHPQFNWTTYLRELFWRQYAFITRPAIFGLFLIKDKRVRFGILFAVISLLSIWNFTLYSRNLRYLMPVFGILVVLFGIFWAKVGEVLFQKPAIVCLTVMALLFAGGYKIVRKPAIYYTPNADFYADVQNADYKTFFNLTYEKFPDFDNTPVFSNLYDPFAWYSTKKPDALFMKAVQKPSLYNHYPVMVYPELNFFIEEMKKYPSGYVFMEDWQSLMPDDIKEYVKKNLKLELRVESMSVSPEEKWPLELYSWGFDEKKAK